MFSFKSTRTVKIMDSNTGDSNGCILGSTSLDITLFFQVTSVTITQEGAYALLATGTDEEDVSSTYGRYKVTIETSASDDAITQAEGQIMALDEFSGAVSV